MIALTRRFHKHPCLAQIQLSVDNLLSHYFENGNGRLRPTRGFGVQLSGCSTYSTQTENSVETTPVCVDFLRRQTNLQDPELFKIISSVETIGFNAVGQMYRKNTPEPLDYTNVRKIIDLFQSIEGVNTRRLVRNSPFVLASSPDFLEGFEANKKIIMEMFQLNERDLGKILSSNAYVLSRSVGVTVQPCANYLKSMGFSRDQSRSIVLRFPRILALSTSKMDGIKGSLLGMGIDNDDFAKIVWKFPPVMGLSAAKLEMTRKWMMKQGLLNENDWKIAILKFPQIVSHNLEEKYEPTIQYMLNDLQLPFQVVKVALLTAPDVFGRTLDRLKYNVAGLRGIGMNQIDLARYLTSFPGGLRMDIQAEPYKSKLEFLENKLGQRPETVLPVHPRYLSYSMERISSRAEYLQSKQRSTNGVTGWCAANDLIFAEKFARSSLHEWKEFKAGWKEGQAKCT